jgi:hypothetical protein
MTTNEISPTFCREDQSAIDSLESKRSDLARARKLSPSLVATLESEIAACELALTKARTAAVDYDREGADLARATAVRRHALTVQATSTEVDPEAADRIIRDAARAQYLELAYRRRVDAARDAATSMYFRACKEISERTAAVRFAEILAGAVVDREEGRIPNETRPGVIAWLPLVFPIEGRAAFTESCKRRGYSAPPPGLGEYSRSGSSSYPEPPPIIEYENACRSFFARVDLMRETAARQAADLAAVSAAAE